MADALAIPRRVIGQARRRAAWLFYAAVQFVVLTALAMHVYAGGKLTDPWAKGYDFSGNFLSELGATRSWAGQPNTASAALFTVALGSLGLALVLFSATWRAFAFDRGRARAAGIASQVLGTASGAAFFAVAVTPVNLALHAHNTFVVAAFALLLGYSAALTVVWAKNGATRVQLAASGSYVALVCVYVAVVIYAVTHGAGSARGLEIMVLSQKAIAYASMLFVGYLTFTTRRRLAAFSAA